MRNAIRSGNISIEFFKRKRLLSQPNKFRVRRSAVPRTGVSQSNQPIISRGRLFIVAVVERLRASASGAESPVFDLIATGEFADEFSTRLNKISRDVPQRTR
ncbi:hypothetical protein EVAR_51931_1 [Eumeta japonica]|uniref:Uncharacterized protein n=1 Tax=Eumeta variegata TaxID=151549 RepID=A0A4C1YKG2_EUMVA|nr:hypothetical protein EVAR_51931_1 [Eumeta japonica]